MKFTLKYLDFLNKNNCIIKQNNIDIYILKAIEINIINYIKIKMFYIRKVLTSSSSVPKIRITKVFTFCF